MLKFRHSAPDIRLPLNVQGRGKEIQGAIKTRKAKAAIPVPKDPAYVEGVVFDDYMGASQLKKLLYHQI